MAFVFEKYIWYERHIIVLNVSYNSEKATHLIMKEFN